MEPPPDGSTPWPHWRRRRRRLAARQCTERAVHLKATKVLPWTVAPSWLRRPAAKRAAANTRRGNVSVAWGGPSRGLPRRGTPDAGGSGSLSQRTKGQEACPPSGASPKSEEGARGARGSLRSSCAWGGVVLVSVGALFCTCVSEVSLACWGSLILSGRDLGRLQVTAAKADPRAGARPARGGAAGPPRARMGPCPCRAC